MKRFALVIRLSLAAMLLFGCRGSFAGDEPLPPIPNETPDVARVVCDGGGARVMTPEVEAGSDGVHLAIENSLASNADLSVSHSEGGMGWSAPPGQSERVANVPPGKVRVACIGRLWGKEKLFASKEGTIRVLAGDSGYKSAKLDCPRGKPPGGLKPYTEEETQAREGDPVDLLRGELSGSLREGDIVEAVGNTRSRGERTVRVVRDGKVVANAHYIRISRGWLGGLTENCAGF